MGCWNSMQSKAAGMRSTIGVQSGTKLVGIEEFYPELSLVGIEDFWAVTVQSEQKGGLLAEMVAEQRNRIIGILNGRGVAETRIC